MNVFVIIVTYKGQHWYDRCFSSLRQSTIPIKTIVVDNSPGDNDAVYIQSHYPEVYLIKTNENLGFGRANNLGMRYALDNGCDYVFLLNQDTLLEQTDAIEKLVQIAQKNPEYGIISPMHLSADKKKVDMNIEYDNHLCSYALVSDLYCNTVKEIYSTDYINAAAWLLPRHTLERVGGFDPVFRHYEEDDNYLNRVIYHGLKVGLCPGAFIIHDHPDTERQQPLSPLRQKQFLLVEWTDLNKSFSIGQYGRYYARKWMVNVISGRWTQAKRYAANIRYLFDSYKSVKVSRTTNMLNQPSWL